MRDERSTTRPRRTAPTRGPLASRSSTDTLGDALGVASVAAGLALWIAPGAVTELFSLPSSPRVGRLLAARDLGVGALILARRTRPLGLSLRALSDATDAVLAGSETLRGHRPLRQTVVTIVGALGLSVLSHTLARIAGGARDDR